MQFLNKLSWIACLSLLISGCTTSPTAILFDDTLKSLENTNRKASSLFNRTSYGKKTVGESSLVEQGSGAFVSSRAPIVTKAQLSNGANGFILNLLNVPVEAAAKNVLGDILGVPYTIAPNLSSSISLQTGSPVSKQEVVELFETALAVNEISIVRKGSGYQLVPSSDAVSSTPSVSVASVTPRGPGVKVQVLELRHIGAEEMSSILKPITREGTIVRVDPRRNHIVLAGTNTDLDAVRDAASVFDVDWMRGRSVALHPLSHAKPNDIVHELEQVFGVSPDNNNIIRFLPNTKLNSVLVITARPSYLKRAARWIKKLDGVSAASGKQLFVYNIQNRPAAELANVLKNVLQGRQSPDSAEQQIAPDLQTTQASLDGGSTLTSNDFVDEITSVVADIDKNALLISTTRKKYAQIEKILHQLDTVPTQVLLEAVIAEVTLNDELKFGMRWAIENGGLKIGLSDVVSGFAGASFPGSSWGFSTSDVQVTLNALSAITDVNVISSPTIMALNNQTAILQVGDQVPIVTQQATNTVTANAPIVNSVTLKDTGIILRVLPRVNSSGRVNLDIEQEVSSVTKTTTSGIDSPTIQQRRISTQVVVHDGESLALGGLIQERNSLTRSQVPILGNIPIIGNAFKNKTDGISRTELIIFIKPRVVRNAKEAREVTAEFRNKLGFKSPFNIRRGGTPLQQDLKRLKF